MRIELTRKDVGWSYIGTIVSMGANFFMLPFLIYFLDGDMLGLWYVFSSIGAIAALFDMGFGVTFARNITYCWSGARKLKKESVEFIEHTGPDFNVMHQVLTACKVIYAIISGLALVLLLTFGTWYISYISRFITGNTHIISWIIYAVGAFLNLFYGYYASFLRGVGAVDRANKNTVIARLTQIICTVVLLYMGTGILGVSIAYLAYGTIFRFLGKYYFYKYQGIGEKLERVKGSLDKKQVKYMLKVVWHNAWRDGMISISNYFCNQASVIICSLYLSLSQTGIYSIGVQITSAIAQIAGTMYNAYQPELQSAYINKDMQAMKKSMSIIVMSFIYLFIFGIAVFIILGIPLLRMVHPETTISISVLIGLAVYQLILNFRNCYTSYFSCTNRILYMNGFLVSAILCIVFSFIATGQLNLGVWGLVISQIACQVIYNLWKWPIMAHKEMNLSVRETISVGTLEGMKIVKILFCRFP